jgi:hypothetical protein
MLIVSYCYARFFYDEYHCAIFPPQRNKLDCFTLVNLRRALRTKNLAQSIEQHTLIIVNNCLNTNIYYYLEKTGGQSSNLCLNVVHFFNTNVN